MNVWDLQRENRKRYEGTRGRDFSSDEHCVICGRKLGSNPTAIEVSLEGDVIPAGDPRSETDESQGWWNIGRECVKKFNLSFVGP